jgi:hypothetical protein
MAFFENRFYMAGVVDSDVKYDKTVNGEPYAWFALSIENSQAKNSTESNIHQNVSIMVFQKKLIDYIKSVNLKRNDLCVVFGWVSAFKREIKGREFSGNGINATQVFAVKRKNEK